MRRFGTWNLAAGAVSCALTLALPGDLAWIPVAAQAGLIAGLILGREVVTE